jgi:hypothetical protein
MTETGFFCFHQNESTVWDFEFSALRALIDPLSLDKGNTVGVRTRKTLDF